MKVKEILDQFSKMLTNLDRILDKGQQLADAKKFDMDILLTARLAPDQFNLIRQIQITCDTAKLCAARLAGKEAPVHADTEKTLSELKTRIQAVAEYLSTFKDEDFVQALDRKITQPRWGGKHMLGHEYLIQHAIPNFYFHFTTAYSILRHNGVDVGKRDYLGELPLKQ